MRRRGIVWLLCIWLAGGGATAQNNQQLQYIGIPSATMEFFASQQRNSNWSWAASIQMVLNYYGVSISQETIVERSYGRDPYGGLPKWTGSFQLITANLNNSSVDDAGPTYTVTASIGWGAPPVSWLFSELAAGRPIIVGYRSSVTGGHAVVITGVSYFASSYEPIIQSIVVRDPYPSPSNLSRQGR